MARPAITEEQDIDALVMLDLPAKRAWFVILGVDQRDQIAGLGTRRDGVNGRPDAEDSQARDQKSHPHDHG